LERHRGHRHEAIRMARDPRGQPLVLRLHDAARYNSRSVAAYHQNPLIVSACTSTPC
jgi:hypothetical protein